MTNRLRSSVEKIIKRLLVPAEVRQFCVVCKVPRPEGPSSFVVERVYSINRTGYDDLVLDRVHDSIRRWGYVEFHMIPPLKFEKRATSLERVQARIYSSILAAKGTSVLLSYAREMACIVLRDFENLKMMYDVNWYEMQKIIFQHKKKDAYALLYSGDLPCDAENAMKNRFERKISKVVDMNYQSFSGNTDVEILTIEGTKTNGRHLSCDFVDVRHAELILSCYKTLHGAGGNTVRIEPHPDEV